MPENGGLGVAQAIEFARDTGLCDLNRDVPRRWAAFRKEGAR